MIYFFKLFNTCIKEKRISEMSLKEHMKIIYEILFYFFPLASYPFYVFSL